LFLVTQTNLLRFTPFTLFAAIAKQCRLGDSFDAILENKHGFNQVIQSEMVKKLWQAL
jgi:hypothetical protein